jgi:hypothetical protein
LGEGTIAILFNFIVMKYIIVFPFLIFTFFSSAQTQKKVSLEIHAGLNGNFFVRSYDEAQGPVDKTYFYKKNFLGTAIGAELRYKLNNSSSLVLGYTRTFNKDKKNYSENLNGVNIFIQGFNIRHINDFYLLAYERRFKKSIPYFTYHIGLLYATMHQQEIQIENFSNAIIVDERNLKNSGLNEAGFFGGVEYSKKIDTKFEVGIRIRGYYLATANTFEAITFTPTLRYFF